MFWGGKGVSCIVCFFIIQCFRIMPVLFMDNCIITKLSYLIQSAVMLLSGKSVVIFYHTPIAQGANLAGNKQLQIRPFKINCMFDVQHARTIFLHFGKNSHKWYLPFSLNFLSVSCLKPFHYSCLPLFYHYWGSQVWGGSCLPAPT